MAFSAVPVKNCRQIHPSVFEGSQQMEQYYLDQHAKIPKIVEQSHLLGNQNADMISQLT